jgi:hypothetical protein
MKSFKQNELWVVELDEDKWYGIPQDMRDALCAGVVVDARANKCSTLAIFALPDALFPMYGKTRRHRVHHEVLVRHDDANPFEMVMEITATVDAEHYNALSEMDRSRLVTRVRDAANRKANGVKGRYRIMCDGKQLEAGRV